MYDSEEAGQRLTADRGDPSYLRFYWGIGLFLSMTIWYAFTVETFSTWLNLNSVRIFSPDGGISPTFLGGAVGVGGCLFIVLPLVTLISGSALGDRAMRLVCPALVIDARLGCSMAIAMFGILAMVYVALAPLSLLLAVPVLLVEILNGSDRA